MAGTVRGTFDLNARPASSALRGLDAKGRQVDRTFAKAGRTLDRIGNPRQVERIRRYERAVASLERTGKRTFGSLRREWTRTDKQVLKSVALEAKAIDHLKLKLEELSLVNATPTVDVDGVTAALAQVELLHSRVRALGRERATPRVGIGAGAVRAAAGAAGGGGGRGGEGLLKSMSLGPLNLGRRGFPFLAAAGLPAATSLGGAAVGVAGSAGAGALGAGALGIAGGGIFGTALASIASVAIPTAGKLKEASDALSDFQEEVKQSGRNSVEAREAWRAFNRVVGEGAPGTRRFIRTRERVQRRFTKLTGPARQSFLGMATDPFEAAGALTPQFAGISNRFFGRSEEASNRFFGEFATGGRSRRFLSGAGDEAIRSVDEMEAITEHVLGSLMNITVASRPFFREALNFLEEWTGGWLDSTDNVGKTRREIGGMVGHLRTWLRLGGATFELLKDVMSAGAGPGRGLVFDLTKQLETWDRWVERNPRAVRQFFRETVSSTKELAGALGRVTEALFEISRMLGPLLDQFSGLVQFLGNAGLLTPGGLPLLLGAGAGVRNARGAASSRILGGRGGGFGTSAAVAAGAAGTGFFGGRGRGGFGRTSMIGRSPTMLKTPYGPIASPSPGGRGIEVGQRVGQAGGRFARGFGARAGPLLAISAGLGALSTPGNFEERVTGGLSAGSFGIIPPLPTGAEREDTGVRQAQFIIRNILKRGGSRQKKEAALRAAISRTRGMESESYADRHPDSIVGLIGGQEDSLSDEERATRLRTQRGALRSFGGIRQRRGAALGAEFQQAFAVRAKDQGLEKALETTTTRALKRMGKSLKFDGSRVFAQSTLSWAKEAARKNPELQDEYGDLAHKIEDRFRRMGHSIEVIHGRIYTDTKSSWQRIGQVIKTEAWAAEQESSKAFGALEREMFRRLRGFGFSQGAAKSLIQNGGDIKGAMTMGAGMAEVGNGRIDPHFKKGAGQRQHGAKGMRYAGGGRLSGFGKQDTVGLPGGGLAAPGEAWIANRHTERRINSMLGMFGTSLGSEIGSEKMRHSSAPLSGRAFADSLRRRFARGGLMPAARLAQSMGLHVGEGPGFGGATPGVHTGSSLHYSGLAYDVSGAAGAMRNYRAAAERAFLGKGLNELFYDPYPYYIDEGQKVPGAIGNHGDHVHIGFFPGGAKGSIRGMGGMAAGAGQIRLGRQLSKRGGVPGALAQRAMDTVRGGLQGAVNQRMGGGGGRGLGGFSGGGAPAANMALARRMMTAFGFPASQWPFLKDLGMRESGWRTTIANPSSGAYGIPQALPGSKMASAGADWRTNPATQIRWMLQYIKERYGSPSGAISHHDANNWYARGGRFRFAGSFARGGRFGTRSNRPVMFQAGEGLQREDVEITPRRPPGGTAGGRSSGGGRGRVSRVEAHLHFHGPVSVRSEEDLKRLEDAVGRSLLDALKKSDSVAEEEVIGS